MISPLAHIHPKVIIAKNVTIGPFTYIEEDVEIGEGTWIAPNVSIFSGTRIGKDCKIFPGAVIGAIPQDLKFDGEYSTVEIGERVVIRECVTINRGTKYSYTTMVGSDSLLMAYVHVAHDCVIGNYCILANCTNLAGHVIVEDHVAFGGLSGAHQFIRVGKNSFIAGGTLLRKDVPPYVMAAKDPTVYSGINSIGLKRRSFTIDQIHVIQDIYRYIYNSGMNISQALQKVEADFPHSAIRDDIVQFIRNSERGVIKGID